YALRVNITVALLLMTKNTSFYYVNNSSNGSNAEFNWDFSIQGYILAASYLGNCLTQLPSGLLARRFGGKNVFGVGILVYSLLSLLNPFLSHHSVYLLIISRFIQGAFEGFTYPTVLEMWSKWAPQQEKTFLVSISFAGTGIGNVFGLIFSGIVAKYLGWQAVFYLTGGISSLWCIVWFIIISDTPESHPSINHSELSYIQENIERNLKQRPIPWINLLTSLPFWAIVIIHFSCDWGTITWMTELPSFMETIYAFDYEISAFLAALPSAAFSVGSFTMGKLADIIRTRYNVSTTIVRKLFCTGGLFLQMVCLVAGCVWFKPEYSIVIFVLVLSFNGMSWSNISVNPIDLSPENAAVMMGISNCIANFGGMISPALTGIILNNVSSWINCWKIIIYINIAINVIGGFIYIILGSGENQDFEKEQTCGEKPQKAK
ncbi:hypothetical protein LOTGIDRAFT_142938, partial [Lottia gigantea]